MTRKYKDYSDSQRDFYLRIIRHECKKPDFNMSLLAETIGIPVTTMQNWIARDGRTLAFYNYYGKRNGSVKWLDDDQIKRHLNTLTEIMYAERLHEKLDN